MLHKMLSINVDLYNLVAWYLQRAFSLAQPDDDVDGEDGPSKKEKGPAKQDC